MRTAGSLDGGKTFGLQEGLVTSTANVNGGAGKFLWLLGGSQPETASVGSLVIPDGSGTLLVAWGAGTCANTTYPLMNVRRA
jgi:hypothetical protein